MIHDWLKWFCLQSIVLVMIIFTKGDIFKYGGNFSYAHCISQDKAMFRGVARVFVRNFPELEMMKREAETGRLGHALPVKIGPGFVYNLVTKRLFFGKPVLCVLRSCLVSMRDHALRNGVNEIHMPLIGAGHDKLDFCADVFPLLLDIVGNLNLCVRIFYLSASSNLKTLIRFGLCWLWFVIFRFCSRDMDLDRRVRGVAYIGRIKSMDSHQGEDEVYGVVYCKGKGVMDYSLFKSVCSTHNDRFFYARKVNGKQSFTMRECLTASSNFPMLGDSGVSMLEHPMTFPEFGLLAHELGFLSSESGLEILKEKDASTGGKTIDSSAAVKVVVQEVPVPSPPKVVPKLSKASVDKKRISDMMKTASCTVIDKRIFSEDPSAYKQSERQLLGLGNPGTDGAEQGLLGGDDIPFSNEEVIGGVSSSGFANLTVDGLRDRCLVAETKVESLGLVIGERDEEIALLKAQLESSKENSAQFMASSSLEAAKNRATRTDNASELVDGLKPEFGMVKGLSSKLAGLSTMFAKTKSEQNDLLAEIVHHLEALPERLTSTFSSFESAVNENSKTLAGNVMKVWKVLEAFGISMENTPFDVPHAISTLARVDTVPAQMECREFSTQTETLLLGTAVGPELFDVQVQTYSLPTSSCTSMALAPNGLSRWISPPALDHRPVVSSSVRKPFDDYMDEDCEIDDEGEVVELERKPSSTRPRQDSPKFLLKTRGTRKSASGVGLYRGDPSHVNNNVGGPGFSGQHGSHSVWANPPPSLKRSSSHLDQRSAKR